MPLASPRGALPLYYAVQFGKTMLWVAADLIAFYVLATVEKLPIQDVTLELMGGLAWHAISDAAVGQWLEKQQSDARTIALIAGISVPIASAALVAALLLAASLPWAALVAMMTSRSAFALFDVPHQALIGRMASRGWPVVRIVGLRNLWGQVAPLTLGLGLAPLLGEATSNFGLTLVLATIAVVAAAASLPIVVLLRRLWEMPRSAIPHAAVVRPQLSIAITAVLALHLGATLLVAATSKVALAAIAPGVALAILSAGRIVASIPLPARWREQRIGMKLAGSALILIATVVALFVRPGPASMFCFGLASGWINILTWAWLGRATDHPRPFGLASMLSKIGLLASIPVASKLLP